jgi:hypothetical protein
MTTSRAVAGKSTEDTRNVEVVLGSPTDCLDDMQMDDMQMDSVEIPAPLVTSPADSDEEAELITQAVVASQAVVPVLPGSHTPAINLGRVDQVPSEAERL